MEFTLGGKKKSCLEKVNAPGKKKILCTPLPLNFLFNKTSTQYVDSCSLRLDGLVPQDYLEIVVHNNENQVRGAVLGCFCVLFHDCTRDCQETELLPKAENQERIHITRDV